MSKHTAGPWMADADDMAQGADDIFTVSIWAPGTVGERPHIGSVSAFSLASETLDGTEYVTADAPSVNKLEEAKANARLIAAAPELLEALQSVIWAEDSQPDHLEDAIRHARAAIAKATGEQP